MSIRSYEDHTPPAGPIEPRDEAGRAAIPPVGSTLGDGRYEIREVLGEGGMSTVLGAFDRDLQRPVAIKILHELSAEAALLDEARVMGAARSSEVVTVYALHLDATPPFLVMERIEGTSLDALLRQRPPGFREGIALLQRIAHAIDGLHARGLAHGDVKAANVIVQSDGAVKLIDLGLTALLRRIGQGDVVGTPSHMPPERARGLVVAPELHARGDVYAFAVVAFHVLVGRGPFVSSSPHDLLRAHATEAPPDLSAISELAASLDAPMRSALAKDPAARPASAGALAAALERAARGTDESGRPARILIVDDDAEHRALHESVLRAGLPAATIETASSAMEALGRMDAARAPHLCVLDFAMPEIDGLAMIEAVRGRCPTARTMIVTGEGSGRERERALALGARDFLVKPVDPDELVRRALAALDATAA